MERVLQCQELDKIEGLKNLIHEAYDLSKELVFFPVRHHSPVCTYHLKQTIEKYKPDAILIEGPSNANNLIDGLTHEDSKPPLSIYYTYTDSKKLLDDEKGKYMCYYPMLKHSPEYFALKHGQEKGIHVEFIDLPYEEILLASKEGKGIREKMKKQEYSDDKYLQRGEFLKQLCKHGNTKDFHEFWEKYFELKGLDLSSDVFIEDMLTYCYMTRVGDDESRLEEEGCISRERYMTQRIKEARKKYSRILVVTGGFHTYGIIKLLNDNQENKVKKMSKVKEDDSNAYLIPYSYKHSDALSGYASGMPYTAFYSKAWDIIQKQDKAFSLMSKECNENCDIHVEKSKIVYEECVKYFIAKCSRTLRKEGEGTSTDDAIQALIMAKGLASLRDKKSCGVNEICEGVRSSFIKGEYSELNNKPLEILTKCMVGDKVGVVTSTIDIPPIVKDFKDLCKKYKLKINTMEKGEKILDIYKKALHKRISEFFHMMTYIDCGFSMMTKGADRVSGKDINLKRETWTYIWTPEVERRLIELSVYGGSIKEAAKEMLLLEIEKVKGHSGRSALALIRAMIMGLIENVHDIVNQVFQSIDDDGEFLSLVECANYMYFLLKDEPEEEIQKALERLQIRSYEKAVLMMDGIKDISKFDEMMYIEGIKKLNLICSESICDEELFIDKLMNVLHERDIQPVLEGAMIGVLYGWNCIEQKEIMNKIGSYIKGSGEERRKCASFLKGLFSTGRDIVLMDKYMIEMLNDYVVGLDSHEFMEILPELRYAFSSFMPREIDSIGKIVGDIYNKSSHDILFTKAVGEEQMIVAKEIDKKAKEMLREWSILDE
ncbi:DUF5682 family protein [Oceanirhabdus sp. W0125-5]|uniref:DUF5682 family protein n=1 Tax=Oceanirhabdus sp. W0125-5 TaxID=2999116 RepID=UPI0022F2C6C6|nr:DUF5682 family protein [Oceanirhabdus sp. W0125-5]WBW96982.1 DUF5682 family protein [Oceanirhabdus sp. W0125-5]